MRTIFVFLAALLIIGISGCSDEVTPPPKTIVPVPWGDTTLLFSFDSLGISSTDSGNIGLKDSVLYHLDSAFTQLKLKYHLKSTGGIAPDNIYYGIFISRPDTTFFSDFGTLGQPTDIDTTRILNISSHLDMTAKFKVAILTKSDHSYRDVYLKNIKLFSIVIITP